LSSADVEAAEGEETDERREALLAELTGHLGDALLASQIQPRRQLFVRVEPTAWKRTFTFLRDDLGFHFFDFLSAIDWMPSPYGRYEDATVDVVGGVTAVFEEALQAPADGWVTGLTGGETRFQVFARVLRIADGDLGVVVKADVPAIDGDPTRPGSVESIAPLYAGADWHEREIHEMYGIGFEGHRYLEHIYLPSGFEGHPLRKDYPLLARVVKPWPGIVDVEPMPGGDDEGEEESA